MYMYVLFLCRKGVSGHSDRVLLKREWAGSQDYAFCSTISIHTTFHLFTVCVDSFQMVSEKLQEVFILEDNVDFEPNFRDDLEQVLEEAHRLAPQLVGPHVSQMQVSDALIGEWM